MGLRTNPPSQSRQILLHQAADINCRPVSGTARPFVSRPIRAGTTDDLRPAGSGPSALIQIYAYVDAVGMDQITILQADVLRTLASPRRLEILHRLSNGPMEVGRLAEAIGASQPNVSQHLALLRSAGLVEAEREGREVRYRVADSDVIVACELMRTVLERRLTRLAALTTGRAADDASVTAGSVGQALRPTAVPTRTPSR